MPDKPDLSLVLLDDIYQELCNRFDSFILCYVNNRGDKTEEVQINFKGGKLACIGLAEHCKDKILADMRKVEVE